MSNIKVKIAADSINQFNNRLTTFILTYPRIIHAEVMTHRMFSRNAASSRAVPVDKMIESVKNNMFIPFAIQKTHKGMQGSEYLTGKDLELAQNLWVESAELALAQAKKMQDAGITKQIINRILEPYQYYTVIITASEFENFFALRCPRYVIENVPTVNEDLSLSNKTVTLLGRSKKQLLKQINEIDNDCYTGFKTIINNWSQLDWLKLNKGQSEIHMMQLAECMWDEYQSSTPKELKAGEWHIPFGDKIEIPKLVNIAHAQLTKGNREYAPTVVELEPHITRAAIKISTAKAARVSYTVVGEEDKESNYENDIKLHDNLLKSKHLSPFEHIAKCMTKDEYPRHFNGVIEGSIDPTNILLPIKYSGWSGNYQGFIQYRKLIE